MSERAILRCSGACERRAALARGGLKNLKPKGVVVVFFTSTEILTWSLSFIELRARTCRVSFSCLPRMVT